MTKKLSIKMNKPAREIFRLPTSKSQLKQYEYDMAALKSQCQSIANLEGELEREEWQDILLKLQIALSALKY